MAYKTLLEIRKNLGQGARWWNDNHPDPRFVLGEIYTIRFTGNRKDETGPRTGQVTYSVRKHHVKLTHEDGNNVLYIHHDDEVEITHHGEN